MLSCRSCHAEKLNSIIPLGALPLANALLKSPGSTEEKYNLEIMLCEKCGLAQLKDLINPKDLFSDYVYFSSNSDAMLESVSNLVDSVIPTLDESAFIIEIASNDGYLLKNYVSKGISVLGIEPAENIAKVANQKGINTLCDFFGEDLAKKLVRNNKKADIIHANNVMAHVPDINGFIKGLKVLLKDNGKIIIEVPHFLELVKHFEFDTIYHEHVYYFSLTALQKAFERHELYINDVERIAMHGGSLRLFISHKNKGEISTIITDILNEEKAFKLHDSSIYPMFMEKIESLKKDLIEMLKDLKGEKVAAYGASAKGTTLLNYYNIGSEHIQFVVDRSPVKQGLYTPGKHLEIKDPRHLMLEGISHALLLTWNFVDEIMAQQKEFINKGGKFIIPLPNVKVKA